MKCNRCTSIMVPDKVYSKAAWSEGWRCPLCGDFIDQVILENRQYHKAHGTRKEKEKFIEKTM